MIVVFFIIGVSVGYFLGNYFQVKENQLKIQKAIEKLPTSGVVRKTPDEIFEFNGNILKIDKENKNFILKIETSPNPLEDWPLERKIIINNETKFYQRVVKDSDVYIKEKLDFQKGIIKEAPKPYFEKEISFDDLKENDFVVVKSLRNIKFSKTIEASNILKLN